MKRITRVLIVVIIALSISITYYKTVVQKDFTIIDESSVEE